MDLVYEAESGGALFVGSSRAARGEERLFDVYVGVAENIEEHAEHLDRSVDLYVDERVQEQYSSFEETVNSIVSDVEEGKEVLVFCHEGKERSPSLTAAALAILEDIRFFSALGTVESKHPSTELTTALQISGKRYVDERRE